MKTYRAFYYNGEELAGRLELYANNKKQADTLAIGFMVDPNVMDSVEVKEMKGKKAIEDMSTQIMLYHGEEQLLKEEINIINCRRTSHGLEPIELKD